MKTYAQYCPIARASEILAQRWTPIIVRDLLHGPTSFSRLADGAPGLSRTLLTTRLRELQRFGLVDKDISGAGGAKYRLTEAGENLAGVLDAMGRWGEEWLDVTPRHSDPGYVLNSWVKTYLATDRLPEYRVVVRFDLTDQSVPATPMWVVFDGEASEVCARYPGYEEDLIVTAESVALAEWHLGRIEWGQAVRNERIAISGNGVLAKQLPSWNSRSRWAHARAGSR